MGRRDGDRRRRRHVDAFDIDAGIYFAAVVANGGALSAAEKDAYNIYRIDSKDNANPYNSDCHIDLPMIGGTVESMVVNAQNPGTFDQIAVNTVSGDFTANGFAPNGSDSYFRMGLIASVTLTIQSIANEYYSRDNTSENTTEMGVQNSSAQAIRLFLNHTTLDSIWDVYNVTLGQGRLLATTADISGGVTASRTASNLSTIYRKGVSYGSIATTGGTQPTLEFYLGALNNNGTAANFSTKECTGAGIYDGLLAAQVLAQFTARQVLNTSLSRQV